jgi:hypothetical protein
MKKLIYKFVARQSKFMRENKFAYIKAFLDSENTILDVGVWCNMPEPNPSENWLEKQYSEKVRIIAVGLNDMREFRKKYPQVLCVQADGCALPFKDNAVDVGFSNAVLEHVPSQGQLRFAEGLARVVQKKAVLAVPDRLSPIEIHSRIFFLHWLPWWRHLFILLGERYWASPENLTCIFTRKTLKELLLRSTIQGNWDIKRQFLVFVPVSLIAIFNKEL